MTGWLKVTREKSPGSTSSTDRSTAYVYSELDGSGAGIACGPLGPTVHSVEWTVRWPTGVDWPLALTMLAVVPGGNSRTERRVPLASVTGVASATCMPAVPLKSTFVDAVSVGVITASGSQE